MPAIGDQGLVGLIRRVLADSPFAAEGYRKVRARLHLPPCSRSMTRSSTASAA
jgi:hypothetical protein